MTDTNVTQLVINKLTKAQYDALQSKSETELYLVPDEMDNTPTSGSTNPVTSDGIKTALDTKQDTLVSGTNIKTINNESILGAGNVNFAKYEDTLINTESPVFNDIEVLDASTTVYTNTIRYTLKPNQKIVLSDTVGTNKLYLIDATDDNAKSILISKTSSVSWNNLTNSDIVVQLASESDSNQSLTVNTYWRGTDNVFIAEYGVTTAQEIQDALDGDKIVVCHTIEYNEDCYYWLGVNANAYFRFQRFITGFYYYCTYDKNTNKWAKGSGALQDTSQKVTSITSSSTNNQYPTAKAVYDYVSGIVGEIGTILDQINGE